MKIITNILKKIIDILLTLVIIVGIVFVFLYAIRIEPYVVLSGSMEPTLHVGSLSFINKNITIDEVKKGDIVAFRADKILVAHRVYSVEKNGLVTKGDANKEVDGLSVTISNYIGVNVFNIPYVGYGVRWIQTPKGKIISATLVVCLIVTAFIFDDDEEKKEARKKKKEAEKSEKKKTKTEEVKEKDEKKE